MNTSFKYNGITPESKTQLLNTKSFFDFVREFYPDLKQDHWRPILEDLSGQRKGQYLPKLAPPLSPVQKFIRTTPR